MIFFQVEDIESLFASLSEKEATGGWESEGKPQEVKRAKKKVGTKRPVKPATAAAANRAGASSKLREMIAAKRQLKADGAPSAKPKNSEQVLLTIRIFFRNYLAFVFKY